MPIALALGACSSEPSRTATSESAITNGTTTNGDPGVVALVIGDALTCTATLIAPRVLLTAAHCVPDGSIPDAVFGSAIAGGTRVHILTVKRHPTFDESTLTGDVAMALLDADAPANATAWPLPSTSFGADAIGTEVRLVGFGQTGSGDSSPAQKRSGTATIASLGKADFQLSPAPSQTCAGDSGGPAFATIGGVEVIVGITSSGDPACASMARDMRVDAYSSFIAPWLAATAAGASGVGQRCYYAGNCAVNAGACTPAIDDPALSFCSPSCGAGDACDSGLQCIADADRSKLCRHPTPSPGANGSPCADANDCNAGSCDAPSAGGPTVCAITCFPDIPSFCSTGFQCATIAGSGASACFAPPSTKMDAGCNTAGAPAGETWIALGALYAFAARRRRRIATSASKPIAAAPPAV